jgi:hypothetical protein
MNRQIVAVWECPSNEGTADFRIGCRAYYPNRAEKPSRRWIVGEIKEVGDIVEGWWIHVYDDGGRLRISLPSWCIAIEFSPDPEGGDDGE